MYNILGLDLGTNSIGWAIRDLNSDTEDQIVDYGVVIFKKGVGEGKSGEYSLAAERRTNRSKRRLYNAKRYRKWATLKVLSENRMCPLSIEELKLWSAGIWQDGKNKGRLYPSSPDFKAWLAMDFERIEKNIPEEIKLNPEFANTYFLRTNLLENVNLTDKNRLYKIGRAFYHLVQRRGFKTSRKSGKSTFADNELFKKFKEAHPDKSNWKPSQIYLYIQSGIDPNPELRKERIRNNAVIQRSLNEDEFFTISKTQQLSDELTNKLHKAIYFVRPLRTQKGLVGKCTLEKGKSRIPISHPAFEEFRALSFINNIQRRELNSKKSFENIPIALKRKILEQLFFRRLEKGKNKGKIDDSGSLEFSDIIKKFDEDGKWEFNYSNKPNISTCPFIAGLMNFFDNEWESKFIETDNQFGINWDGLSLVYNKRYNGENIGEVKLDYDAIWHLLFDYLQTKDDEEALINFCKKTFNWSNEKITDFIEISISQGYGSLSKSAINKILPFLQQGYIYSEAVSFANLSTVIGKEKFENQKKTITERVSNTIRETNSIKQKLNIANSLIQSYFSESTSNRAKGFNGTIQEVENYKSEVEKSIKNYFGEVAWDSKAETEKQDYRDYILDKYLIFLSGKQSKEEKASFALHKNPEIDYYKLPRLDEAIKNTLTTNFNITSESLKKLYHPSDIEIYPKASRNQLEDPNPPSKGWKNPMAMRTMHELRKLINFLLSEGKISSDTKIVIEMARELNDANRRWAIQTWQRYREEENKELAKAIIGVAKEKYPNINENDADNIDKVRLWWEQLTNGEEIYKTIKTLKEDVDKYKLWREQGCQCIYTGKIIKLTDLFSGAAYNFEHTLPLSKSFDNSLTNLTVCDAEYNQKIKRNKLPASLDNYDKEANGYSPILPRLEKWFLKVSSLKERIDKNKADTKNAIRAGNIERKNDLIKMRHLLQFEYEYWFKKTETFTVSEIPNRWKNSQLIDTQIITKYARAYLKTLFSKVDVQKAIINTEFRNIYGISGNQKKDRSKHSHHAIDAAVLTLIPGSAKREAILEKNYLAKENKKVFLLKPYPGFEANHILKIEENVLINHITKDQTLSETKKIVRKRGKIVKYAGPDGKFIKKVMQGDCIRGQLHDVTYFGAIKVPEKTKDGFSIKENGNYLKQQKNGNDEIWLVKKEAIAEAKLEDMIDTILLKHINSQLENGKNINEVVDFNNKKIRHVRCKVKSLTPSKALYFKNHIFKSKHPHKQQYIARNTPGSNYLNILYEGLSNKQVLIRAYRIISLFEFSELKTTTINALKIDSVYNSYSKGSGKNITEIGIKAILKVGQKILMWDKNKNEISNSTLEKAKNRLYVIYKFNYQGSDYTYLQHHTEARPDSELGDGDTIFNPEKYQPRLKLSAANFNCLIENIDFIFKIDGTIELLS